jgi:serine phosphatase RsbU (regulator of sigma subunit)
MKNQNSDTQETPRLRDILKEDILQKGHIKARYKEWKELQEFYLTDAQKDQIKHMKSIKGWIWKIAWILRSMFFKLSPFRRMLVIVAILLIFISPTETINNSKGELSIKIPAASILLIIVIMLELKDKLLARDELEAGRKIQNALMPEQNPHVEGWQIMLYTRSANEVGGDLVDFIRIEPGRIGISLADISGKGLHAALLMSKLQATIRALASDDITTEKLVARVNNIFHRDTPPSIFASLLYVELAPASDDLKFINAGHFPPVIFHGTEPSEMPKGELGLGLKAGTEYSERAVRMTMNDVFIGYSDGITEARNEAGEFYGLDRFKRLLPPLVSFSAAQIGKYILEDVERFVGEASTNDDMSLIILKRS